MNDGGPAFPRPTFVNIEPAHDKAGQISSDDGMSLRDWFAGRAMQAFITAREGEPSIEGRKLPVATASFLVADKMIAERGVQPPHLKAAIEAVGHMKSILEEKDHAGVDIEIGSTAMKSLIRWAREANAALHNP